jgi:hypothetical protein
MLIIGNCVSQVKGEQEAVSEAVRQISALIRSHCQRRPQQQVTPCSGQI